MARLAALGGLALLDDDGLRTGSAARGRNLALLALLARAGEGGLTREKVAAFLWPERDTERSRHSLNQAVYTLRRELGADVLAAGPTSLSLNPAALTSDVAVFQDAVASGDHATAVGCYPGPFLDGFHLSGAPEFEEWVDGERATLHRAYLGALEALATDAARRSDVVEAADLWRRMAAAEPLSSRMASGLMRALDAAGDRAGALRVARAHAERVEAELGAAPDPSVVAYEEELRREGPVRRVAGAGSGHSAPSAPRSPATAPPSTSPAPPTTPKPAPAPPAAQRPPTPGRRPSRAWVAMMTGVVSVLVAGAILSEGKPPAADQRPTVAVRPFENETTDTTVTALGRLAADWITEGLVETGLVRVTDPNRPSSAETVVSGRIYRAGGDLRVQARITRVQDGTVVRALDAVGVSTADASAALEPLRQRVLGALGTLYDDRLATWTRSESHPPTYAAYREFARGVELMGMPRDLPGAEVSFRRAAELDRDYLLPRLWLAWVSGMDGDQAKSESVVDALRPERARMSPLERAWFDRIEARLDGDNEASFQAARRMVEVAPGSGWTLALANAALDVNRPAAAISALRSVGVEALGTEAPYGWFLLTSAYHRVGEYDLELSASEEAIRSHGLRWGYVGPGVPALAALGRMDDLERRLEELRHGPPLEEGLPAGPTSLLSAVTELRVHGFPAQADSLADRWLPDGARAPGNGGEGGPMTRVGIELLYESGRWDEAGRALSALPPDSYTRLFAEAMRGLLAARKGDTATAEGVLHGLEGDHGRWDLGEPQLWRARIEAVLGRKDDAVSLVRQALAKGQGAPAWFTIHTTRDFDGLREREDFGQLVRPRS